MRPGDIIFFFSLTIGLFFSRISASLRNLLSQNGFVPDARATGVEPSSLPLKLAPFPCDLLWVDVKNRNRDARVYE